MSAMTASRRAGALLVTGGAGAALFAGAVVLEGGDWWPEALPALFLAASFYLGGAAANRGGRHRAARRLLAVGALHLAAFGMSATAAWMLREQPAGAWLAHLLSEQLFLAGLAAFVGLFAVFPTGTYERPYERHATRAAAAVAVTLPVIQLLASPAQPLVVQVGSPPPVVHSPLHVPALAALAPLSAVVSLLPVLGVVLFVLRYRRASPHDRTRMRWPLVSVAVGATGILANLLPGVPGTVADVVVVTALASFPVTVLVGIRRHRLLDVDLVLSRTLVYAVLSAAITLVYGVGVGALGLAAGARVDVQTAVVVTIVTAVLFQPARQRLERLADRLVRGRRREGYPLLRELGSRLEQDVSISDVADAVVGTVASGLRPRWIRLCLADADGRWRDAAVRGSPREDDVALSAVLTHGDAHIGTLECGPPSSGGWTDEDRDLLATLCRSAALAVHRARLTADLAASRARLVQAQDAERRRIERDLHDGVQQHLVALMAALEVARIQLSDDPLGTAETLRRAQDVARDAHRAVRGLARGIRPPILGDRGLVAAVESQLSMLPLDVQIDADPCLREQRFAPEVESAAYFLVTEALTNVAKHAGNARVRIRIRVDESALLVDVVDDGAGFAGNGRGTTGGLSGLRDRVEALGGRFVIDAAPGRGTALHAVLPARVATGVR
jgi:signal transduction histidine kinase